MQGGGGRGGRGRGRGRGLGRGGRGRRPPVRPSYGRPEDPWSRSPQFWSRISISGGPRHDQSGRVNTVMMHNRTAPCAVCDGPAAPYNPQLTLSGLPDTCLGDLVDDYMNDFPGATRREVYNHIKMDVWGVVGIRVHVPQCVLDAISRHPQLGVPTTGGGVDGLCVCPCTACVLHHGVAHGLYGSDGWPGRATPPWPGGPEAPDPSAAAPAPAPAAPAPAPAPAPAAPSSPEFEFMDIAPAEFERRVRAKKA